MEARTLIVPPRAKPSGDLAAWIGVALFAPVAGLSGLLLLRRLAGALAEPLPLPMLAVIGLLLAAWSIVMRMEWPQALHASAAARWGILSLRIVLALTAFSLSLPGIGMVGLLALWAPLVAVEIWTSWPRAKAPQLASVRILQESQEEFAGEHFGNDPFAGDDSDSFETTEAEPIEKDAIQSLIRRRDASGAESVSGWLRADFAPGERTTVAYLAFCPPLADAAPQFSAEPVDGPSAEVKPTRVASHGARLEIKLEAPAPAPLSVRIEFSAWTSAEV